MFLILLSIFLIRFLYKANNPPTASLNNPGEKVYQIKEIQINPGFEYDYETHYANYYGSGDYGSGEGRKSEGKINKISLIVRDAVVVT